MRRRAFTLIELLVVVGLIALLAGGLGMALRDAGGNALATAQTTLATMVGTARAQAAVNQTEAIVAIYGTRPPSGDPEKFLRMLQVFRAEPQGSSTWVPVGNPVALPPGVYIVPPSTSGLLASGVVWQANPPLLSTLSGPAALRGQATGTPFGPPATAYTLQFNADGTVKEIEAAATPPAFVRLVVATAGRSTQNLPQFNNNAAVKGILIRRTGAVTMANQSDAF